MDNNRAMGGMQCRWPNINGIFSFSVGTRRRSSLIASSTIYNWSLVFKFKNSTKVETPIAS